VKVVFGAGQPGSTSNPGSGDGVAQGSRATPQASPSRALARARNWERQPDVVANLAARAAGLSSPPSPTEGDLVPSATGWLIGRGPPGEQLYPTFIRWANRCFYSTYLASVVVQLPVWHPSVLVGGLILGLPLVGALASMAIVPRARLRRQFKRAVQADSLADVPRGTLVRVTGTIAAGATVPTLFRGVPAVLFRNRISSVDETRGQDFLLDLHHGEQAKVAARRSYLLDAPKRTDEPPACGPVRPYRVENHYELRSDLFVHSWFRSREGRYESSVGPGDRVEVCGIVEHVLDPTMENPSPRQPPMRPVLMGDEKTPLLVRGIV
jgi:hypothetical protein